MNNTPITKISPSLNEHLQSLIDSALDEVFPAMALTIIHNDEMLLNESWGFIDPETRQNPVQTHSIFDLASVSKLFTTTAFLSLVSAGKVELDDRLASVIPEFGAVSPRPIKGGQDPHTRERLPIEERYVGQVVDPWQVTFRQLLTHTSGLAPWRDVFNQAGKPPPPPDRIDPVSQTERWQKALTAIVAYPFAGQPGEMIRYSDLGMLLLGEAINRLHGKNGVDVAIRERVLKPIGLEDVWYNPMQHEVKRQNIVPTEFDADWRERRAWGEVHDENAAGAGGIAGHAGLFASAKSIALFGRAWLEEDGAPFGIDSELATIARQEQMTGDNLRRGLGWMLNIPRDSSAGNHMSQEAYGHLGFTGTSLWIDPETRLIVACLTNRVYPGRHKPGIHTFRRRLHDILVQELTS